MVFEYGNSVEAYGNVFKCNPVATGTALIFVTRGSVCMCVLKATVRSGML